MSKLTAIIPTRNEEKFIRNCLASVKFADEILVLDSGSTDKTVAIAKDFGAKVIEYQWQGFRYAHEFGAKQASHDWLLYVDADERVSQKLRQKIQSKLINPDAQAYRVRRANYIMGQKLKHGGWYPDYVTRLMHKPALKSWIGELHEYPEIEGQTKTLDADLIHLTHRGMDWMLAKTQKYTRLQAQILYDHNHPPVGVKNFIGAMGREFWYRAIRKQGWRDGFIGWLEIFYQTFNAFLVQAQLWELQQSKTMTDKYNKIDQKIEDEL